MRRFYVTGRTPVICVGNANRLTSEYEQEHLVQVMLTRIRGVIAVWERAGDGLFFPPS